MTQTKIVKNGLHIDPGLYDRWRKPPRVALLLLGFDLLAFPDFQLPGKTHLIHQHYGYLLVDMRRQDTREILHRGAFDSQLDYLAGHEIYRVIGCATHEHKALTRI
jgi:hypothetical protein